MAFNRNNKLNTSTFLLLIILTLTASSSNSLVKADTVQLAECPKEPNVIGVYINNGKNCVRERNEVARDVVNATCKNGWELVSAANERRAFCRDSSNTAKNNNKADAQNKEDSIPKCPVNYQRYGKQCHSACPRGYNSKRAKCIQLKDSMPQHSMTCPTPPTTNKLLHRIGAFCCEPDQCSDLMQQKHEKRIQKMQQKQAGSMSAIPPPLPEAELKECNLPEVPGRFYYNTLTGRCDRSRVSEPRVWTKLPRDSKNRPTGVCHEDETKILGGCQPKCPLYYKSQKGMCHLPPCSIPFGPGSMNLGDDNGSNQQQGQGRVPQNNNGIVLCPEGKYYLASKSF
mmetsp:Transcript_41335/g.99579  ORF Transcript_41335/g.99579 Transcript_41335/m.99579 type:complete len:341 (+) Transcript_41335:264-1286(+)